MQELAGRLTALDPEASASLRVIASFDALVAGGVGIEALVRAAAVLGGTIAGARIGAARHGWMPTAVSLRRGMRHSGRRSPTATRRCGSSATEHRTPTTR